MDTIHIDNIEVVEEDKEESNNTSNEGEGHGNEVIVDYTSPVGELNFTGKLVTTKTLYGMENGEIKIIGKASGGYPPYQYEINGTIADKTIVDLASGEYKIGLVDSKGNAFDVGVTKVEVTKCIEDYNASFVPLYDEAWELPVVEDVDFKFTIFGQSGEVYSKVYEASTNKTWDGKNNKGSVTNASYYRFEVKYSDGEKCYGNVTVGN